MAVDRVAMSMREDGPQALDVWDADQREGTIERAVATSVASPSRHTARYRITLTDDTIPAIQSVAVQAVTAETGHEVNSSAPGSTTPPCSHLCCAPWQVAFKPCAGGATAAGDGRTWHQHSRSA